MFEWQSRARPVTLGRGSSGLKMEPCKERLTPHVPLELLCSRQCGRALLLQKVPAPRPPSHRGAPVPSGRKPCRSRHRPLPPWPRVEVTKAAAESLPSGWMRRSPSCRGGARVETDGAGEVRLVASAVAARVGRTEGTRMRAAVEAAAGGRERRVPPQAERVTERPRGVANTCRRACGFRGSWMGMSGGRRIEERVPGSGVGQREPTDTRLKGVQEQGKGPALRQRRVGVSPGQCPGALEKSVSLQPHHHGNGRGSSAQPWCLVTCVYPVCATVCLLPLSLSHLSALGSRGLSWTETYCSL